MKVIGKDRTSCDVCNPIDEILARLDALERRASAIVAKVQGIAPDGEGNVTLPTSSSDTDPLHGRVDAFAMSSEVKEAADDAHAYAASIADDVVVINSEIDALNQAVAELQPAEIEAIKTAVQALQTTVATLESTVATLNNSIAGKVSKSGDTMTGNLTVEKSWTPLTTLRITSASLTNPASSVRDLGYTFEDSDGYQIGSMYERIATNGDLYLALQTKSNKSGSEKRSSITIYNNADGTAYATAPSWSVGTNDNSDKILTIKMANSLPSLVHTTGNETVAGNKIFTGTFGLQRTNPQIIVKDTDGDSTVQPSSNQTPFYLQVVDKNGKVYCNLLSVTHRASDDVIISSFGNDGRSWSGGIKLTTLPDGTTYAECPTTPSGATGKEIVTANWVLARINELATKNGLMGL